MFIRRLIDQEQNRFLVSMCSTRSMISFSLRHLDGEAISGNGNHRIDCTAVNGSNSQFTTAFVIKKDGNKRHQF